MGPSQITKLKSESKLLWSNNVITMHAGYHIYWGWRGHHIARSFWEVWRAAYQV